MNKKNLEQYAKLENMKREIEAQQAELKEGIIDDLLDAKKEKAVLKDVGMFTLVKRKTWHYSKEFSDAKEELLELLDAEQQDGTATFEEKTTLAFYPNKE